MRDVFKLIDTNKHLSLVIGDSTTAMVNKKIAQLFFNAYRANREKSALLMI